MRWIRYTFNGQKHEAGPYEDSEANSHFFDIAGYDGIMGVHYAYSAMADDDKGPWVVAIPEVTP